MKILDEIERIVGVVYPTEEGETLPYVYGSLQDINYQADSFPLPCIAAQLLINGELKNEGGQYKDETPVVIMFFNKTEFEYDAPENQVIIDTQKAKAISFMREIDASTVVKLTSSVLYDNIYDVSENEYALDVGVTGVALRITLKERAGQVNCFVKPE